MTIEKFDVSIILAGIAENKVVFSQEFNLSLSMERERDEMRHAMNGGDFGPRRAATQALQDILVMDGEGIEEDPSIDVVPPRIVDGDHSVPGEVDYTINQKVIIKKRKERVSSVTSTLCDAPLVLQLGTMVGNQYEDNGYRVLL